MLVDPASTPHRGVKSPAADPAERLLSRGDAARYLGVPVTTVYQWARTGRLPYKVTLGGHLRFSRSDLDAAVAQARPRRPGVGPRGSDDTSMAATSR